MFRTVVETPDRFGTIDELFDKSWCLYSSAKRFIEIVEDGRIALEKYFQHRFKDVLLTIVIDFACEEHATLWCLHSGAEITRQDTMVHFWEYFLDSGWSLNNMIAPFNLIDSAPPSLYK